MTADISSQLVPKLRFPEFSDAGYWHFQALSDIAKPISKRVGTKKLVPMSVTTGVGLVSQEEKFGRSIAGNSYKNYVQIQMNDFAYNKSATKAFPQGYIARYSGSDDAAVPNSIFTCFRPDTAVVIPEHLDRLFHRNHHGTWLRKYITVGARAHGALSVSVEALMSMPVPLPPHSVMRSEQQKIADCLDSLDDLIVAEGRKLGALHRHKQGLVQQLFPLHDDSQPRLRFPGFRSTAGWQQFTLGDIANISKGKGITKSDVVEDGRTPCIRYGELYTSYGEIIEKVNSRTNLPTSDLVLSKAGDVIIPASGETKEDIATSACVVNDGVALGGDLNIIRSPIDSRFLSYNLNGSRRREIARVAQGDTVVHLYPTQLSGLKIHIPVDQAEQELIADSLSSLDTQIVAQELKLKALDSHKQGLLQQLFPFLEDDEQ